MTVYLPLTGKRRRLIFYSQLFLGPDHLLLVHSSRFEQRYQRFFYKDIQALVVTGLPARRWMQASLGILAGAIVLLAFTAIRTPGWTVLVSLFGIGLGVIALVDFLRGERCGMIVKTPVSNEPLAPVSRMSIAKTVIARLRPAIELAQQGEWTPGMAPAEAPAVMAPRKIGLSPADRLIPALLTLVTIDAALVLAARIFHRNEILLVLFYSILTEIVLAVTAVRRRGDDPRWLLYALSGAAGVCATLDILGGVGIGVFLVYTAAKSTGPNTFNPANAMAQTYPQMVLLWALGWRVATAATGWVALVWTPKTAAPPPDDGGLE